MRPCNQKPVVAFSYREHLTRHCLQDALHINKTNRLKVKAHKKDAVKRVNMRRKKRILLMMKRLSQQIAPQSLTT
jgi:trehalose-6-phosphate synthase